jgi:hypothetical protein
MTLIDQFIKQPIIPEKIEKIEHYQINSESGHICV